MTRDKIIYSCALCENQFQFGPHFYDGKYISRYQITVCMSCWTGNWDGWAPHLEERLIAHLQEKGLPTPERNAKGWLPRE